MMPDKRVDPVLFKLLLWRHCQILQLATATMPKKAAFRFNTLSRRPQYLSDGSFQIACFIFINLRLNGLLWQGSTDKSNLLLITANTITFIIGVINLQLYRFAL